jgi:hypothetical protein
MNAKGKREQREEIVIEDTSPQKPRGDTRGTNLKRKREKQGVKQEGAVGGSRAQPRWASRGRRTKQEGFGEQGEREEIVIDDSSADALRSSAPLVCEERKEVTIKEQGRNDRLASEQGRDDRVASEQREVISIEEFSEEGD